MLITYYGVEVEENCNITSTRHQSTKMYVSTSRLLIETRENIIFHNLFIHIQTPLFKDINNIIEKSQELYILIN